MEALSIRDYRNNLAASFDRAAAGETVIIRRKNRIYTLVCVGKEDFSISPDLQKRIQEVRESYADGNSIELNTENDIDNYFNSL